MTVMVTDLGISEDLDLDLDLTVFEMPGDEELTPIGMSIGCTYGTECGIGTSTCAGTCFGGGTHPCYCT